MYETRSHYWFGSGRVHCRVCGESASRCGLNRADERLWESYDWFQQRFNEDEPVRGGLFDLNRYYYSAH